MPYNYQVNSDIKEMIDYPLPSTDGQAVISVRKRLGWDAIRRVRNAAVKRSIDPRTGEETITGSMDDYYTECVIACALDPATEHTIYHDGEKVDLTEHWILHEMHPLDMAVLGMQMAQNLGMLGMDTEGNVKAPSKKRGQKSSQTADVS